MTELLEQAIAQLQTLPESEQDAIAAMILTEIEDDRRWDELFSRSPDMLAKLAASAMAELPIKQYVKQRDNGYWLEGTRISLDSVVYSFLNGESPESITQNFPLLSLEQVYGAITFYLANQELVDAYLKEGEADFRQLQELCKERSPLLYQKSKAAQSQKHSVK